MLQAFDEVVFDRAERAGQHSQAAWMFPSGTMAPSPTRSRGGISRRRPDPCAEAAPACRAQTPRR